jgi:hypothetical protein
MDAAADKENARSVRCSTLPTRPNPMHVAWVSFMLSRRSYPRTMMWSEHFWSSLHTCFICMVLRANRQSWGASKSALKGKPSPKKHAAAGGAKIVTETDAEDEVPLRARRRRVA